MRGPTLLLGALAVVPFTVYLLIALARLAYPFELEWMEGAMADHTARVLDGKPIHGPPSLEWTPGFYAPLFFYLSAAASLVFGEGLLPLRVVSLLASIGCFAVIYRFVQRETRRPLSGLIAASLFAATYGACGAWFDLGRVDTLFLFLLLAGSYAVRFGESTGSMIAAGLLLAGSFLTKQTALVTAAPLLVWAVAARPRRGAVTAGTFAGASLLAYGLMQWHSNGWYAYYAFELPSRHYVFDMPFEWLRDRTRLFLIGDLAATLPLACALASFWIALRAVRPAQRGRSCWWFYVLLLAGALFGSWSTRLYIGGWKNVLMPAYAVFAILFGLGFHTILESVRRCPPRFVRLVGAAAGLAFGFQLFHLRYPPGGQIPSAADTAAGEALISKLAAVDGEVFVPSHGYLAKRAGKNPSGHLTAFWGVLGVDQSEIGRRLVQEIVEVIEEKRFAAIVLDDPVEAALPAFETNYGQQEELFADADVFFPVTGAPNRPQYFYTPN